MSKKKNVRSRTAKNCLKKNNPKFGYVLDQRHGYCNGALHEDFRAHVNDASSLEAHLFLKAGAALEGVPMNRLHKLPAATKRLFKSIVGDNLRLPVTTCRDLMSSMVEVASAVVEYDRVDQERQER